MHGHDLTPLLKDPENANWPHLCLYEHTGRSYGSEVATMLKEDPTGAVHNNVPWYFAVNDGRWKYIRYRDTQPLQEELFDLQNDPLEENNLAKEAAHAETLAKMGARCDELREELLGDVTAEELGVLLATEIALDETALLLTAPLQLLTNVHEPSLPGMLCVHQLAR